MVSDGPITLAEFATKTCMPPGNNSRETKDATTFQEIEKDLFRSLRITAVVDAFMALGEGNDAHGNTVRKKSWEFIICDMRANAR